MYRLKQLRMGKGMTQQALAIKIGVTQTAISTYEIGRALPPLSTIIKMADLFETTIDYLLERSDIKNRFGIKSSDLSQSEQELVAAFRKLGFIKQEKALGMVIGLGE